VDFEILLLFGLPLKDNSLSILPLLFFLQAFTATCLVIDGFHLSFLMLQLTRSYEFMRASILRASLLPAYHSTSAF
jgi:hypothetical protein